MKRKLLSLLLQFSVTVLIVPLLLVSGCSGPGVPPELSLSEPQIAGLSVTVDGATHPGTIDKQIIRTYWYWGDGVHEEKGFPASHTYDEEGTFTITVISIQDDGLSTEKSLIVSVSLPHQPTPTESVLNVAGTWSGPYQSSLGGSITATIVCQQSGTSITGTLTTSKNQKGNISGTISGKAVTFTVTVAYSASCVGKYNGIGVFDETQGNKPTWMFEYSGSSPCYGAETGSGNMTKQQ